MKVHPSDALIGVRGATEMTREINTMFDGYAVTETGDVVSYKYNKRRVLRPGKCSTYGHQVVSICVNGAARSLTVHRLVWKAFNGDIPDGMEIDHIDRNPKNNAIVNLRLATRMQNSRNSSGHKKSTSKHTGVTFHSRFNKWQASIRVNRRLKHLGYFDSESDAHNARQMAAERYFGEYAPR